MINSAKEFVELRTNNDERATHDEAKESIWLAIIRDYPDFKEWVVHNKTIPPSILRILAGDTDSKVRFAVAMKRKCEPTILEQLAKDDDETVRVRVAYNQETPAHVLEMLKADASRLVIDAVASRSK